MHGSTDRGSNPLKNVKNVMDNQPSVAFNLSLQGTAIRPGVISSRPSSARSNSQAKQSPTPSREGSARERRPSVSSSVKLSSARERRLSNSSQRSLVIKSPPIDDRKSSRSSTASSVFRVLSPQHHEVEAFFTDQSQQKSFQGKSDDDEDWNDTRQWVDELHHLHAVPTQQHQTRDVGPMGMSRDSLNGTIAGAHLFQSTDNRREQAMSPVESTRADQRTPTEGDMHADRPSSALDHLMEHEKSMIEPELVAAFDRSRPTMYEQEQPRVPSARKTPQQDNNNASLNSSRRSSASSIARHRRTPVQSSLPPTPHTNEAIRSVSSVTSSSTATVTSKITVDEVYEALKKLEEVEQFPLQPPLADDSAYLIDPSASLPPPFIDDLPLQTSHRSNSSLSNRDETNPYDQIVASVRSQKSTARRTPSPRVARPGTPPRSARRQQPVKVVQSVSIPHHRASPTMEQRTKFAPPYKSLMVGAHSERPRDDPFENSSRASLDSDEQVVQPRIDHEGNQRQPIIIQRRSDHPRESNHRHAHETERDLDHHLQVQKEEYDSTIQRHLKFIDQLMDDKRRLTDRCEYLVSELKTIDKKYNDRIRLLEESQQLELQKLRDVHEAAEKLRRERWIEDKTKKIKELTVRGLEPEIQKLIGGHKNEITKIKAIHEAELLSADERAAQRYLRMTDELRDQLEREKEVAIARERTLAQEKYEKSLRDEERSFNEQRRRLYAEIEEEKNRQADMATKQRADIDKLRRDIEENHRKVAESTKHEYEEMRLEQGRRQAGDVQALNERLTLEKQNWEENYMKQQEILLASKERQLRDQMKQERDKEIERIIAQFEADTTSTKEEVERTAENRVKRIRDKYEAEFRELENSERQTKERYNQVKAQLTEVQGESDRLQVILKQKEAEITDIRKITDALQQERERLSDIIRQEFADRLVLTDDENRRIKGDIAELRARQQLELDKKREELEALQQRQEKELETIQDKIKQAIAKKDEQVQALRVQYETATKRAQHLEGLLAQQRKLISAVPTSGGSASRKVQPS